MLCKTYIIPFCIEMLQLICNQDQRDILQLEEFLPGQLHSQHAHSGKSYMQKCINAQYCQL